VSTSETENQNQSIRIATSSCLLGQEVRYDGAHKLNGYMARSLSDYFEFVPFCPEVAIGLGIPRKPIRLMKRDGEVRVVGTEDAEMDVTDRLVAYGEKVAPQLGGISGYIFKKGSPSCGMERVKVYSEAGYPVESAAGKYAETIMRVVPELPVEEEGRLMDSRLRENFIERVFIYYRWQQLVEQGLTPAGLVDFHTRHKFNVMAHDEPAYRDLGRLVADAGKGDIQELATRYLGILMAALIKVATPKMHANVLMHIMGFVKQHLDSEDKKELLELIDAYRVEQVPLIVPVTLIKHYLRRFPDPYMDQQYYLSPHPKELMLRNHI
jgi:uncharacterized protein YbgA (DUF1722 family)/uncharacterized protein YbbK (DUF523 family)